MGPLLLSHAPLDGSLHVYLNGIEQRESVDWELLFTPPRVSLLAAMKVRPADKVEARYAYVDPATYAIDHEISSSLFVPPGAPGSLIPAPAQAGGCSNPMAGYVWATPPTGWTPQFTGAGNEGPGGEFDLGWTFSGPPTAMPGTFMQGYDILDSTGCLTGATGVSSGAEVTFYTEHYTVPAGHHFAGIIWGHLSGSTVQIWAMLGFG